MSITYSNPRQRAEFSDWPSGPRGRVPCVFEVHSDPKKGTRVSRTTTGKPKYSTYALQHLIIDGDDGRTYFAARHATSENISVFRSDFMSQEYLGPGDDRWHALHTMFQTAAAAAESTK